MKRLSGLLIGALLLASFAGLTFAPAVHAANQSNVYAQAFNDCVLPTGGGTCSVTLGGATYGDLLAVAVEDDGGTLPSLSDTFTSPFHSVTSVGGIYAATYYVQLLNSGSDTITLQTTTQETVALQVFEVQGLFSDFVVSSGRGSGTGTALSTSSVSYSGFTWFCMGALEGAGGALTAGTSYTLVQTATLSYLGAEYSTTVSSPTTFPATSSVSGNWYDAGTCFARSYINPSDVQLVQANTPATSPYFYINEYQNSYLAVNYPGVSPTVVKPVTVPQLDPSISGSNLLTMWVGSSYFATLIPTTNNTFYLSPPSQVSEYTFNVQDLSGQFGAGSEIQVEEGNVVMRSGYLDGSNSFVAWLPAGYYTVVLTHGSDTYSVPENLPLASGVNTVSIQILYQAYTSTCGGLCEVSYGANITGTDAIITYKDLSGTTTSINDSIYRQNATGTYRFYTHVWSSVSSLTDSVPCDNDNCNSSIASQMYVVLIFSNTYSITPQQARIQLAGGFGVPLPFSGLNDAFGWGYAFPNIPVSELVGFAVVLIAAAGMGALAAKFGSIVIAVLVAALSAFGWFPGLSPAIITLLVAFAVLGFVAWLEQGR